MTTLVVVLPLPPKALSPNMASSRHWRHRHKATAEYRLLSKYAFQRARPLGWNEKRVRIDMDYRHSSKSHGYRPRDAQNAIASVKAAIDGFVDAGMTPSDSLNHVSWGSLDLATSPAYGNGMVTFTITPISA